MEVFDDDKSLSFATARSSLSSSSEEDLEAITRSPSAIVGKEFEASDRRPIRVNSHGQESERRDDAPGPKKVNRADRRGLWARFAILAEVEDPHTYGRGKKWFITFVVAVAAVAAPMGSAILYPALDKVAEDLGSSPTITNMSIALYMLSMSIFPLWWSAFSEHFGRRTIYLISFLVFELFSVLSAISKSIGVFIAMRVLAGGASASVQAVGAGTIADIWEVRERGRAMGIFYLGPLCGPLFAPIVGGILSQELGWRSTMWLLAIYGGVTLIFIFFALPETLKKRKEVTIPAPNGEPRISQDPGNDRATISSRRSIQQKTVKLATITKMILVDPLKTVLYLRFPPVFLTVYYASITFGSLYVLNISVQDTFHRAPYNFPDLIVGLLYIPASLGYFLASLFGGRWMDHIMRREAIRRREAEEEAKRQRGAGEEAEHSNSNRKLVYRPEDRMRENAWLGSVVYPCALIWYGWTAEKGVFWLVPVRESPLVVYLRLIFLQMIASFFFGCGSMLIFSMATTMLTEFMPRKSSAGVAVNNFVRNIFSCVGGIVAAPIIKAIGDGWIFTILGLWALSSCVVIWAMRRFGPRWRKSMDAKLK
ncbi:MAG: hypothetical protein Q9227_001910 [Pyrenula ochraceoflavens]